MRGEEEDAAAAAEVLPQMAVEEAQAAEGLAEMRGEEEVAAAAAEVPPEMAAEEAQAAEGLAEMRGEEPQAAAAAAAAAAAEPETAAEPSTLRHYGARIRNIEGSLAGLQTRMALACQKLDYLTILVGSIQIHSKPAAAPSPSPPVHDLSSSSPLRPHHSPHSPHPSPAPPVHDHHHSPQSSHPSPSPPVQDSHHSPHYPHPSPSPPVHDPHHSPHSPHPSPSPPIHDHHHSPHPPHPSPLLLSPHPSPSLLSPDPSPSLLSPHTSPSPTAHEHGPSSPHHSPHSPHPSSSSPLHSPQSPSEFRSLSSLVPAFVQSPQPPLPTAPVRRIPQRFTPISSIPPYRDVVITELCPYFGSTKSYHIPPMSVVPSRMSSNVSLPPPRKLPRKIRLAESELVHRQQINIHAELALEANKAIYTPLDLPFPHYNDPQFIEQNITIVTPPYPKNFRPKLPDIEIFVTGFLDKWNPPSPSSPPASISFDPAGAIKLPRQPALTFIPVTDALNPTFHYLTERMYIERTHANCDAAVRSSHLPWPELTHPGYRERLRVVVCKNDYPHAKSSVPKGKRTPRVPMAVFRPLSPCSTRADPPPSMEPVSTPTRRSPRADKPVSGPSIIKPAEVPRMTVDEFNARTDANDDANRRGQPPPYPELLDFLYRRKVTARLIRQVPRLPSPRKRPPAKRRAPRGPRKAPAKPKRAPPPTSREGATKPVYLHQEEYLCMLAANNIARQQKRLPVYPYLSDPRYIARLSVIAPSDPPAAIHLDSEAAQTMLRSRVTTEAGSQVSFKRPKMTDSRKE